MVQSRESQQQDEREQDRQDAASDVLNIDVNKTRDEAIATLLDTIRALRGPVSEVTRSERRRRTIGGISTSAAAAAGGEAKGVCE